LLNKLFGPGQSSNVGFKVENDQNFMNQHYLQYPVVRINFVRVSGSTFAEMREDILKHIALEYKRHSYLVRLLGGKDKEDFQRMLFVTLTQLLKTNRFCSIFYLIIFVVK
jgi:hypothetical protein